MNIDIKKKKKPQNKINQFMQNLLSCYDAVMSSIDAC